MRKFVLLVVCALASSVGAGEAVKAHFSKVFVAPVQALLQASPTQVSLPSQAQTRSLLAAVDTAVNQAQATKSTLVLQDLPTGFQPLSGPELADFSQSLWEGDYKPESLFAFQEDEHFEYIMGFTTLLSTPAN